MNVTATLRKTFDQPLSTRMVEDALSALLQAGFDDVTSVDVTSGPPLIDGEREARLDLTNVVFDMRAMVLMSEAIEMLLFKIPFIVTASGETALVPKGELPVVLGATVKDTLDKRQYDQRVRDEAYEAQRQRDEQEQSYEDTFYG